MFCQKRQFWKGLNYKINISYKKLWKMSYLIFYVKFRWKKKSRYNKNLDLNRVTDDQRIWKTVKTLLSSKENISQKVTEIDKYDNQKVVVRSIYQWTGNEDFHYSILTFWKKYGRQTVFSTLDGACIYWKKYWEIIFEITKITSSMFLSHLTPQFTHTFFHIIHTLFTSNNAILTSTLQTHFFMLSKQKTPKSRYTRKQPRHFSFKP